MSIPFSSPRSPNPTPGPDVGGQRASDPAADPWGVRRAEQLLTSLEGVLSARVVTTPLGEVCEVHVLAQSGLTPKQLVRNIESALLAHLGLKVDHRKISIAQTADVKPIEALQREVIRERAQQRAALFEELAVTPSGRAHRVILRVTLSLGSATETAEAECADTPKSRVDAAAEATIQALEQLMKSNQLALEGTKIVDAFEREFVMVAVTGLGGRESRLFTGTAQVKESPERAAVFAALDATNRWTDTRRPA